MADAKLQELQEQKNAKYTAIKELADRQDKWTAEDRTAWEAVNGEYDGICNQIKERRDQLTNSEAIQKRLQEIEDERKAVNGDRQIGLDENRRREENPEAIEARAKQDRTIAWQAWLRCGGNRDITERQAEACKRLGFNPRKQEFEARLSGRYGEPAWASQGRNEFRKLHDDAEYRVGLDVATSGAGLETIPEGFLYELEQKLQAYGGPRPVCRVLRTATGNALPMPTVDDTGNQGVKLAEATTIGTSVDPTFAAVTLNAYKYSSKPIFISQELLEDSAFNLAAEIGSMLGTRLGRIMGQEDTVGDGSGDPNGIVTASTSGVTAASTTAFTSDELIDLVHTVNPAYRAMPSVGFMFHDTVLKYVRKFKDANGQYLWQPGMQAGVPDRVYGYPYTINQHMDSAFTTGKKLVLFADFSKFIIRDVAQLRFYRLDERYRDTDQTAFIAFMRHDADTIQATAIQRLTLA
jgi:HK97 family phage major capsid protein